ncbi:Rpn family recombination-promoting nuclease/putative transposase [Nocardia camponoti]|uniref:Transposase (putative) YhgA-like domain-containing protein n=1 Tax=Nocardia camponoti TaxID=1616106 RepID=A0A917VEU4_9NOCA|nr:Rpn family recombination-promoting nuclease/putative transposase [Nocardia camponoti]GGK67512.1 hypothetical protein GCM10011591_44590 [Nocardia camponoti]
MTSKKKEPGEPNHPHDTLFRRIMSRPDNAASELAIILPEEIAACIDWSTLRLVPGGFVSEKLKERFTDLLYHARLIGVDEEVFLYLLIEHQARGDRFMALRMAEYATQFWRKYLDDHRKQSPTMLPLFIPVVVHTGPDGNLWTDPTELADLIDTSGLPVEARDRLAPYLPRFRFMLEDVAAVDLEVLRKRPVPDVVRLLLIAQRVVYRNEQLHVVLHADIDLFRHLTREDLQAFMTYIVSSGRTSTEALLGLAGEIGPVAKEAVMTTAEQIAAEADAETLLKQIARRFQVQVSASVVGVVRGASRERVQGWLDYIFDASSVDDLLAH